MFFSTKEIEQFANVAFNFIIVQEEEHTLTLTLNRPEKRNAFTPAMVSEIVYALQYAQLQQHIWCIIIKANGPVFCAGMDLNVFNNPLLNTPNATLPKAQGNINLSDTFQQLTKPTISQVEGAVLAGGFLIICNCTFVVSTEEATFGLPEVKRGLFPMQVIASLLTIMPQRKALQLCILAENLSAQQAKEYGIVTHLSSKDNIENVCLQLQQSIIGHAPLAISKGLEAVRSLHNIPVEEQSAFLINELDKLKLSSDFQEGLAAFKEKRKRKWNNK